MNITKDAQEVLKESLKDFNKPSAAIHVFSTQGCCGPSIQMDISTQIQTDETAVSIDGVDFYVEKNLLPTLDNVTIAYGQNGFYMQGLAKKGGCC